MKDYKTLYENALERVKDFTERQNPPILDKDIMHQIFPELKESEDKKAIRLIKKLIDNNEILSKKDTDICYAWIEKQGESIKIKKGKNYLCTKTHKYAGVEWIEGVKYYSPEDYSLVNQGCTCYCPKYSKEEHNNFFKEVEYEGCLEKPTWSEEDEKNLKLLNKVIADSRLAATAANILSNWLNSIKPNHWKPSEYDISLLEEIARNIRNNVRPFCSEVSTLEDLIENLKKL